MTLGSGIVPTQETRHLQPAKRRSRRAIQLAERSGLAGLFIVMIIVFSILEPSTFATLENWRSIATSQSVVAVAALAVVFPLVCGRFDLSVGAIVGVTSIAAAGSMSRNSLPLMAAIVIALVLGSAIGLVNGMLISYFGINSLISTIGMSTVLGGVVTAYTGGIPISSGISSLLTNLSVQVVAGIPALFIIMVVIGVVCWLVLKSTVYGRQLRAVGSNETAATLTGLPVRRTVMLSFVVSGFLGGCAGVLQIASQGNGNPQIAGITYLLPAIAAVFLGATTIVPGEYNVPGTILALFFVGAAVSGLTLAGAASWITDVFNGAIVIIAVGLAAAFRRRRTGAS